MAVDCRDKADKAPFVEAARRMRRVTQDSIKESIHRGRMHPSGFNSIDPEY